MPLTLEELVETAVENQHITREGNTAELYRPGWALCFALS